VGFVHGWSGDFVLHSMDGSPDRRVRIDALLPSHDLVAKPWREPRSGRGGLALRVEPAPSESWGTTADGRAPEHLKSHRHRRHFHNLGEAGQNGVAGTDWTESTGTEQRTRKRRLPPASAGRLTSYRQSPK